MEQGLVGTPKSKLEVAAFPGWELLKEVRIDAENGVVQDSAWAGTWYESPLSFQPPVGDYRMVRFIGSQFHLTGADGYVRYVINRDASAAYWGQLSVGVGQYGPSTAGYACYLRGSGASQWGGDWDLTIPNIGRLTGGYGRNAYGHGFSYPYSYQSGMLMTTGNLPVTQVDFYGDAGSFRNGTLAMYGLR